MFHAAQAYRKCEIISQWSKWHFIYETVCQPLFFAWLFGWSEKKLKIANTQNVPCLLHQNLKCAKHLKCPVAVSVFPTKTATLIRCETLGWQTVSYDENAGNTYLVTLLVNRTSCTSSKTAVWFFFVRIMWLLVRFSASSMLVSTFGMCFSSYRMLSFGSCL